MGMNDDPDNKNNQAEQEINPCSRPHTEKPPAIESESKSRSKWKYCVQRRKFRRWVGLVISFLTFIAVVWYACTASKQHEEMIRSNNITQAALEEAKKNNAQTAKSTLTALQITREQLESSRLRDRAFVYFENPILAPYPYAPQKPTVFGVVIPVINAGNMPARRVRARYGCPDIFKPDKPIKDPFEIAQWTTVETTRVIGPKQTVVMQPCHIPVETFMGVKTGKRDAFIIMEVSYIDGFDLVNTRVTQMTRNLRVDVQEHYSFGFPGSHNCSDDNCPK